MLKAISDSSSLNISLPMLIQAIGFIGAMVYGYGQLNARLQFVENKTEMNNKAIKEIKSLQDAPIPSDVRQDEKLRVMEKEIERIRDAKGNK
ncbi:hypothetical protein HN682_02840 [Candidatus Peregrinibacteria bacterium]|jgi:hypothetical protein|nr:hypothetical protein [Candidatus Peregrinibacteria bacterium]